MVPPRHYHPSSPLTFVRRDDSEGRRFRGRRGTNILGKLMAQNPGLEESLRRAHDRLVDDPAYAAAMHAVALSLRSQKIKVFISYRSERDSKAKDELRRAFHELSGGRVEVVLQLAGGEPFRDRIRRAISDAHWFVLLVSDPAATDWCMFETGMFRGSMVSDEVNRLICISHDEVKLPSPIQDFHAVSATRASLTHFFRSLMSEPEPLPGWEALNPHLETETIERHADRVARALTPLSTPLQYSRSMKLTVPKSIELEDYAALGPATIETDQLTAYLFGKARPPKTWGELVSAVQRRNNTDRWLVELTAVLARARDNEAFRPVSGTFESPVAGRVVRPIVHGWDSSPSEDTFEILFVEEICSAPIHSIPEKTLAFLTAVRMNNRIRWEVVERFGSLEEWDESMVDACEQVFSRIEREVQSFGRWDLDLLCANFDRSSQPEIRAIVTRWRELRKVGMTGPEHMTGELDLAFKARDTDRVAALLGECSVLNRRFLQIANPTMETLSYRSHTGESDATDSTAFSGPAPLPS